MKKAQRILFVPGIHTPKWHVRWWKKDLKKKFPYSQKLRKKLENQFSNHEIIFMDKVIYYYWQHETLEELLQKGVEIINDGIPTIIVAHSFGGILAKAMISRAKNASIVFFLTMSTPHSLNYAKISDAKKYIAAPEQVPIPAESMGGYFDIIVPFFLSKLKDGKKHTNYFCEHMSFLWFPPLRKKVIEKLKPYIKK